MGMSQKTQPHRFIGSCSFASNQQRQSYLKIDIFFRDKHNTARAGL
jgi:hypothetical protein